MDDCARLENVFTREGNGGSNPFLSAERLIYKMSCFYLTMEKILIFCYTLIYRKRKNDFKRSARGLHAVLCHFFELQ